MDRTKSTAPEHHSRTEHKRAWRFLSVLLSSCAECGTQDADYYVSVEAGDLTYFENDELCKECASNHGIL